jgi:SAM-dependent methyltransferase
MAATLDPYREKWREAPRGSDVDGRIHSGDLLALGDRELLSAWDAMAARRYGGELGWLGTLYLEAFRDRRILELGSGLGFDGLRFAQAEAAWTFADIVPDNLRVVRRVAELKGLAARARFHLIGDDLSFAALPNDYDFVWAFGSIHHVPFDLARRESLDAFGHLKPGGRWMELVYPRERWLREGALEFAKWGALTDGERTPWVEWHDVEKVRRRLFPAPLRTVLDFDFSGQNYRWLDLRYAGTQPFDIAAYDLAALSGSVDLTQEKVVREGGRRAKWLEPLSFACPPALFARTASIDLAAGLGRLGAIPGVAVDLEIEVSRGTIGAGLTDDGGSYLPGAQAVLDSGRDRQLATLRAVDGERPARLVFRNMRAGVGAVFSLRSATLRVAT